MSTGKAYIGAPRADASSARDISRAFTWGFGGRSKSLADPYPEVRGSKRYKLYVE